MLKKHTILLLLFLCCFSTVLLAQDCNPAVEMCEDIDLPLDGGVGFLLAAGVGYGVKKLYRKKPEV